MSNQSPNEVGVPLGEAIGGYRLVRLIGAGSTSHVYLGEHLRMGRSAAIKVLHSRLVDHPKVFRRLLTEARVVNDIRHPNIVDIIDFIDQEMPRRVALVMEYIAGPSVDQLRGIEPLPWSQACGLGRQLVDAVVAAHRAGVIHRDLKPENLLLSADPRATPHVTPQLKVVDFGIAKVETPGFRDQTTTQTMLGTPAYMAPEQIAQSPAPSSATDVYAVGEILYELLSGQRAFRSARIADVVRQKLRGDIPELPLPPMPGRAELQSLIRRCLAFKPGERPQLIEVVGLLAAVQSRPTNRVGEVVGTAAVSSNDWDVDSSVAMAEQGDATELSEVVGATQPPSEVVPNTAPSPVLDQMSLDSAHRTGRPAAGLYDFEDDRAQLHAETAMSAEAVGSPSRDRYAVDENAVDEMPTSSALPAIQRTPASADRTSQVAIPPSDTLVHTPPPVLAHRSSRPDRAREAVDHPLGRRSMATVVGSDPRSSGLRSTEAAVSADVTTDAAPSPLREIRPPSLWLMIAPGAVAVTLLLLVGFRLAMYRSEQQQAPTTRIRPAVALVEVRSQPPEAFVEDAATGDFLGKTPVDVDIPANGVRQVRVFKVGYTARVVELTAQAPSTWVPLIPE